MIIMIEIQSLQELYRVNESSINFIVAYKILASGKLGWIRIQCKKLLMTSTWISRNNWEEETSVSSTKATGSLRTKSSQSNSWNVKCSKSFPTMNANSSSWTISPNCIIPISWVTMVANRTSKASTASLSSAIAARWRILSNITFQNSKSWPSLNSSLKPWPTSTKWVPIPLTSR